MADFYRSRLALSYTYEDAAGTTHEVPLVAYNRTLLLAPPGRTWETPYERHSCIGADWAFTRATGNASLTLQLSFILPPQPTMAEAEDAALLLEYALNFNRDGTARLQEAFHAGMPAIDHTWNATIASFAATPCTMDEAPAEAVLLPDGRTAAAYAKADLEIILTKEPCQPLNS